MEENNTRINGEDPRQSTSHNDSTHSHPEHRTITIHNAGQPLTTQQQQRSSCGLRGNRKKGKRAIKSSSHGVSNRSTSSDPGLLPPENNQQEEGVDDDECETNSLIHTNERRQREYEASGHHIARSDKKSPTNTTLVHLVKGNLGTGILAIPDALRHSGLLTGCLLLPVLAVICVHCMHMLVWSATELKRRTGKSFDYADVGEYSLKLGPSRFRICSKFFRVLINIFLTLTQLGFCVVYIVFISANAKLIVDTHFPSMANWNISYYTLITAIPVMAFSMVKTLSSLYHASFMSNIFIGLGLITMFSLFLVRDLPDVFSRPQFATFAELPMFLATSIYAFEGIGTVLPLHRNMAHPEEFGGSRGVLNTAMIIVTCLYIAVGFYGYLKYGDLVLGSITLNLPQHDVYALCIMLAFIMGIFLTYGLMLYIPVDIIFPWMQKHYSRYTERWFAIYILRALLVSVTVMLALFIPHIDLVISLVGALASSTLALIFPPMIHTLVFWET